MNVSGYLRGYMAKEAFTLPLKKGDVVLGGRFKNRREVVKSLEFDELGQPVVNGKKLLAFRVEKLLPEEMRSKKTREERMGKESKGSE